MRAHINPATVPGAGTPVQGTGYSEALTTDYALAAAADERQLKTELRFGNPKLSIADELRLWAGR